MDTNLMDKLRLLRVDTALRPAIKMKPMSRYYFSCGSSAAEQFFVFASVAAWLSTLSGGDLEQPREEDDPNSTIAGIVELLRGRGVAVDFSTHKLKQGYGEQVLYILNKLADDALKAQGFRWSKPVITEPDSQQEDVEDNEQVEDETEIVLDKVEEETDIYSAESDEEEYRTDNMDGKGTSAPSPSAPAAARPAFDAHAWRLELERAAPALRVTLSGDGRDWRARHAQMAAYRQELLERYTASGAQLSKLHNSISSCMDKVAARENILNEQFEPLVREYGALLDQLARVSAEYKEVSVGISERQELLSELSARVEGVKQRTESRGSSMNDNSPLVNAKKAVATLKKETQDMDFQITVLMWLLTTKDTPAVNMLNYDSRITTAEAY